MQQVLIVDQQAMALKAMADLIEQIKAVEEIVNRPRQDFNRATMRRYESKMKPLRLKLARLKVKQETMAREIEAVVGNA